MHKKLTILDVLPLAEAYMCENLAGGSLHIVLADGNLDDSSVDFCIEYARSTQDEQGIELATLLRQLSYTQRKKIYRRV